MKKFDPETIENYLATDDLQFSRYKTPYYVYSRRIIKKKIEILGKHLDDAFKIYYSIKANPFTDLLAYLCPLVDGLEVSSPREMKLALDTGMASENILYTGPGKTEDELEKAVRSGVIISAESESEVARITRLKHRIRDAKPKVMLRVNPNFIQRHAGMKMACGSSPFGMDEELVPEIVRIMQKSSLPVYGFHVYTGSQILDADAINAAQDYIFQLFSKLKSHCTKPVQALNLGGGFGIPYFSGHQPLDVRSVCANLNHLWKDADTPLILELGRYIIGEAGIYVCQVVDRKVSRGKIYLVTDGGMHHHLAASGNLGQKVRKNFPVYALDNMQADETETVTVTGKLCTPLDVLAEDVELPKCGTGDYIAIMNSGAYGLTASPVNFLGHPLADEILV